MKIIGVNCSPRKGQSTFQALGECMKGVRQTNEDIETEIIELSEKMIHGCRACGFCKNELACSIKDDFQDLIATFSDEDIGGIIIGSPVYLGTMTAQCKAFLDRSVVFRRNGSRFKNLVGGVLATGGVRSGGQELTIQAVQASMLVHDMVVVSDGMSTSHFGGTIWNQSGTGIVSDEYGMKTAYNLGCRMAEVAAMIAKKSSD